MHSRYANSNIVDKLSSISRYRFLSSKDKIHIDLTALNRAKPQGRYFPPTKDATSTACKLVLIVVRVTVSILDWLEGTEEAN